MKMGANQMAGNLMDNFTGVTIVATNILKMGWGENHMREWKAAEMEKRIAAKMPAINRSIISSREERIVRRRPRDPEEQQILDRLCIYKWQRAIAEGKVKILNKREWYYEFD